MTEFFLDIDRALYAFINGTLSNPVLDPVMWFFSAWPWPGILMLCTCVALAPRYKTRLLLPIILSVIAFGMSDGLVGMLKDIVMRERPFLVLPSVNTPTRAGSFSFPSGHAANTFAFAMGMYYFFRKPGLIFIAIATLVSFSRVYLGVHYVSDVVGGAALGSGCFYTVLYTFRKIKSLYKDNRVAGIFFMLLVLSLPLRFLYLKYGPLDLIGDEAHYWEWTRRLDLSYYSKGPVIAWIIAFTTWIGGNNAVAVRFLAPFFHVLSAFFTYLLAIDLFRNRTAGAFAGFLILTIPLFAAYGVIMTIDSPFLFLWCLALWTFWRAVKKGDPLSWYMTGALIGLGFMTKYIMILFFPCALLFLILSRDDRHRLKEIHPWAAAILGIIVMAPVFIWNARHGWVGLLHEAGHASLDKGWNISYRNFLDFLFSQIGIITPFIVILATILIMRFRKLFPDILREKTFLLCLSLPILAFFLLKSVQGNVEPNWAMVSYPALIVLVSYYIVRGWEGFSARLRSFTIVSFLIIVPFAVIIHFPFSIPVPQHLNPAKRLGGWRELGAEASRIQKEMEKKGPLFVFSNKYPISSELAFYMEGNPVTYCAQTGRRMNQYDLWPGFENLIGYNALFVTYAEREVPGVLLEMFDRFDKKVFTYTTRQGMEKAFTIVRFYNFRGGTFPKPTTY